MTLESLQPWLQWITDHPMTSGFVVFLISLSESLAVVGLVVPGVILMTAIGSLIGAGKLPALETMVWAMLGAIAGDGLSYWLGHYYRDHLKELWPFKKFPNWLDRGMLFFQSHGGKSIILGRFIGPIRPTIPVIAGIMGMTPNTFLFFNIVSAILWAPLYCLPGILIGLSVGQLSPKVASILLSFILSLLFAIWLIFYLLLKIIIYIEKKISNVFKKFYATLEQSERLLWLKEALMIAKSKKPGQLGTILVFCISSLSFMFILWCVQKGQSIIYWNDFVYQCFRAMYTYSIFKLAVIGRSLGEPWIIFSSAIIISLFMLFRYRAKAVIICWISTLLLGLVVGQYYKISVNILRPEGLVLSPVGYSFPSINVLLATIMYCLIAIFLQQVLTKKYRWLVWLISIGIIMLVAFSSIYLGLHWFFDVIASFLLGISCITIGLFIYRRFVTYSVTNFVLKYLFITVSIALASSIIIYNWYFYEINKHNWQRKWPTEILNVNKWWEETKPRPEALYRASVLKSNVLPFDFNWLGSLEDIATTLQQQGWDYLPNFTFESVVMMLTENPSSKIIPVIPRFHRDRLPSLILTKNIIENSQRLVLQLWVSDYITQDGVALWVGTVRLEQVNHKMSLITFYSESNLELNKAIKELIKDIRGNNKWQIKKIKSPDLLVLIR
jgi:membrane protein DedA with SNARE-associated domain/membrane-associated phospholipid phosphatase